MSNIKIKKAQNAISRKIGDKYFILTIGNSLNYENNLAEINEVGHYIWQFLSDSVSIGLDELIYNVINEYDIKKGINVDSDINKFIYDLKTLGLIIEMSDANE